MEEKSILKMNFKKFSKLINQDYGSVKGISLFHLKKDLANGFGATVDYTFQVAKEMHQILMMHLIKLKQIHQ